MSNLDLLKKYYNQFLTISLLGAALYMMTQGAKSGVAQFEVNIPGRRILISMYTRLRMDFGDRVFSQLLVGRDGWLEFTGDQNLDGYQNSANMPNDKIKVIQDDLLVLSGELQKRNIVLVIVVAPNKATIYPDKLPSGIVKVGPLSELDILASDINDYGPSNTFLDVRPALLQERSMHEVYFTTDTHWNAYGSFVAYREIMNRISQIYPKLTPRDIGEFNLEVTGPPIRGLPRIVGADYLVEIRTDFVPKADNVTWLTYNDDSIPMQTSISSNANLPRLLMYMDSFGPPLIRMLAPHFSQATFIQNQSIYPDLLSAKAIDTTHPDIVILEFAERNLDHLYDFLKNYKLNAAK